MNKELVRMPASLGLRGPEMGTPSGSLPTAAAVAGAPLLLSLPQETGLGSDTPCCANCEPLKLLHFCCPATAPHLSSFVGSEAGDRLSLRKGETGGKGRLNSNNWLSG